MEHVFNLYESHVAFSLTLCNNGRRFLPESLQLSF